MMVRSITLMVIRRFVIPDAGRLARSWADAAGELRKVSSGMQNAHGCAPAVAIHQIMPVRNDVVQRTARVAEGHAAIHAAGALRLHLVERKLLVDLEPVLDALFYRSALWQFARVLHEPGVFTHVRPPSGAQRRVLVCIRAGRLLRTWTEALRSCQDPVGARAAGFFNMTRDPIAQGFDVLRDIDLLKIRWPIAARLGELAGHHQTVGDATRHTGQNSCRYQPGRSPGPGSCIRSHDRRALRPLRLLRSYHARSPARR